MPNLVEICEQFLSYSKKTPGLLSVDMVYITQAKSAMNLCISWFYESSARTRSFARFVARSLRPSPTSPPWCHRGANSQFARIVRHSVIQAHRPNIQRYGTMHRVYWHRNHAIIQRYATASQKKSRSLIFRQLRQMSTSFHIFHY